MTLAFVAMRHFGPFLGCDEPPLSWKNAGIGSFAKERLDYMPDVDETHLELKVCQGWEPITRELASDWLRTASYVVRYAEGAFGLPNMLEVTLHPTLSMWCITE
jgi:hypothetical protein